TRRKVQALSCNGHAVTINQMSRLVNSVRTLLGSKTALPRCAAHATPAPCVAWNRYCANHPLAPRKQSCILALGEAPAAHPTIFLVRNPHATNDGQRQRPVCCFAEPCVSVPGTHPGKLTGESAPFQASTPEGIGAVRFGETRAVAFGTMGRVHLSARSRTPVSAFARPSERARTRTPESAP